MNKLSKSDAIVLFSDLGDGEVDWSEPAPKPVIAPNFGRSVRSVVRTVPASPEPAVREFEPILSAAQPRIVPVCKSYNYSDIYRITGRP
jgi:hypothetical protein